MIQTEYIRYTEDDEGARALQRAANCIQRGELVVFPTETVYGLGGDGTNALAAQRIYAAKGRPSDNPLIIHLASFEDAEQYAYVNATAKKLAKAFMPGPLTVILPKKDSIPTSTTGGLDSVAIRCPAHPVAHKLIKLCALPIAAPSANLSGKPSPTCAEHVRDDLNGRVSMIIDGGECEIGLESTIVKIDGDTITLLRPGAITYDALCMICDHVIIADAVTHKLAENERPLSPGMKYRHYAPTAPLVLLDGSFEVVLAFLQKEQAEKKCAILCYDEERDRLSHGLVFPVGKMADLGAQAHTLFHALRDADATDAEIIYAHLPPMEGLGLALYNRMIRAAAHTVLRL